MENVQEQVKTVFNSFDKDGNGYLEREEIKSVAKELGAEFKSEEELDKLMKLIDTNGDGKISLEEFDFWWTHGKTNKMEELVWLKMQGLRLQKKVSTKLEKLGGLVHSADMINHKGSFCLGAQSCDSCCDCASKDNCSETCCKGKSTIQFKLRAGQSSTDANKGLLEAFGLPTDSICVFLTLKVSDSAVAKAKFEDLFGQLIGMVSAFAPPEIADQVTEAVQFKYDTPSQDTLRICIVLNHPLVAMIAEQNMQMAEQFQSNMDHCVCVSSDSNFNDLLANSDKQVLENNSSVSLQWDLNVSKSTMSFVRMMAKDAADNGVEQAKALLPLIMLSGFQLCLCYASVQDFLASFPKQMTEQLGELPTLNQALGFAKENGGFGASQILESLPVAKEFLDAFQSLVLGSVGVTVYNRVGSVNVQVNVEGTGALIDEFFKSTQ